ncbi:adenine methyltransferase [Enterococcus sp. 8G7_MSG3316]|uniref:Adenine methyltransferase n=1 Tax=Candidatus Enterococcus testudinis TaxID=1834191 RepID=A0A242A777_9ENTE|nr:ParB N-terminal domain-containing protein [Enterococcus sp. 8G7_MSG3316]OTN76740.1 adenine methyltransferase [Enterococcus sp. 8G7_MSG3316]
MKISNMKLADLKAADYNPRVELKPGMEEYEKLKQSILEFGFVDPPIFNVQTGNLVGGHQRIAVARDLGLFEEIEVSLVDLDLEKEKALNLALNKISGKWDEEALAALLSELDADQIILSGFDQDEANQLIKSFNEIPGDEIGDFNNTEINIEDFSEEEFDCQCPKCGFRFDLE